MHQSAQPGPAGLRIDRCHRWKQCIHGLELVGTRPGLSGAGRLDECIKTAPSCRPVITFCDECAAVVRAWDHKTLLGSFGSRRPTADDAEQAAMAQCQDRFPDVSCKVEKRICADSEPN